MKRATVTPGVVASAVLIGTMALTGCGPSESDAASVRPENPTPARRTAAKPVSSDRVSAPSSPAIAADPSPAAFEAIVEPAPPAAHAAPGAIKEKATAGKIGIVPRDTHIDVGAETLARRTLLDGKLSLLVPRSFTEMGPVMLQAKYPSQNRPTLVLTNESGAINVAANYTSNRVKQKELPAAFNVIRAQLRNAYPTAHWYTSELTTINGHACFRLDFRTPAVDTQVRNIMVGTVLDGRLLLVSFNTTRELEDTWAPIGEAIVDSIQID